MRLLARSLQSLAAVLACGFFALPAFGTEFRDTQYGFSIVPPSFAAPAEGSAVIRVVISGPAESGFSPNVNVTVQETRISRDAFVQRSEEQFKAAGLTLLLKQNRTVSGRPAVLLEYEGSFGGPQLRFLALAVILPDRVLLATWGALASNYRTLEPAFRQSLESFKLTPLQ